jgi:hypothetical protein
MKASSGPTSDDHLSDVGFRPNKNTLRAVNIVGHYMPLVEESQMRITQIMELMLYTGLASRVSMLCLEATIFLTRII